VSILLLVRHGNAGHRRAWNGDDRLRPLDERGRREAAGLVDALQRYGVTYVASSPAVRCVETVEPLAERLGLEIELREELAEGAGRAAAVRLFRALAAETPVACCHRDLMEALLGRARPRRKGSTWVLELAGNGVRPIEYLPPASVNARCSRPEIRA
jgi:phosphohistidine phosphatase SixA